MAKKIEGYTPRGYSNANNGLWIFMDRTTDAPATVIIHEGRHKHERVFTESEVRAMLKAVRDELGANCRWQSGVEVVSASAMRQAFIRPDVLSLDPA